MKNSLNDVLFKSDKRKKTLLLLQDGAKEMKNLLTALDTTRTALLPQIRVLEEHYLVNKCDDTYELTTIGELVTDEMVPLLNTLEVLDIGVDYWGTHNLDFIPPNLLNRINELRKCKVVKPALADMYTMDNEFNDASATSGSLFRVTSFLHPTFPTLLSEFISKKVNIYYIISSDLLEKLQIEKDTFFSSLIKNKLFHLYVYPNRMRFISFAYNDCYLLLRLLQNNNEIDGQYILCNNPDALKWGKELFDYYLKDSKLITEL